MSYKVRYGGIVRDAVPYARHANIIKPVKEIWVRYANVIQKVWSAVTAAVVGGFTTIVIGGETYRDRANLSVTVSSGQTPSSYAWSVSSDGDVGASSLTTAAITLTGPAYNDLSAGAGAVTVSCTVTVDGAQYTTPARVLTYNRQS